MFRYSFPHSINILITTALNFFICYNCFFLSHQLFFLCSFNEIELSLVLSNEKTPLSSHFLKFLCFVRLGERVTCCGLEGVSLPKSIPYSLCVPSAFGGRAGFDVNTSHVFLQGMLAVITFGSMRRGLRPEKKGLGPKPHVSWGFSFAHWPSLPYLGWEWVLCSQVEALRIGLS